MVFSHGTTQVDTFVPSLRRLQHTLYSWSQLSDYTPKRCWELPATSSDTSQSSEAEGQEGAHNMSICKTVGRICQEDDVPRCPGHPWVSFSYHMQVRQWQEEVGAEGTSTTKAAAASSEKPGQLRSAPKIGFWDSLNAAVKDAHIRTAFPSAVFFDRRGYRRLRSGYRGLRARQPKQYRGYESDNADGVDVDYVGDTETDAECQMSDTTDGYETSVDGSESEVCCV